MPRWRPASGYRAERESWTPAAGVGGSAIWLARTFDVQMVGITPVSSQVERARGFAAQRGVSDRVRFAKEDYLHTSFPDASFDVIWAVESICHAADKAAFYREARRLLRPGGRLGIVEDLRTARPPPASGHTLPHIPLSCWGST